MNNNLAGSGARDKGRITQVLSETNEQDFERKDYTALSDEESLLLTILTVTEDEASSKCLCAEYNPMPKRYVKPASDYKSTSGYV
jgi:hypothetical protein